MCTNLFFSEYIEGSSHNKAVEIHNAGSSLLLSSCAINIYTGGATDPSRTISLDDVFLTQVFVLCHSSFDETLDPDPCDRKSGSLNFNGDDTVELVCGTEVMDVIGQVGMDPGDEWGITPTSTKDHTLRRKCTVTQGDTNPFDLFDPAIEWNGFSENTFDGLGSHCL